MWRPKESRYQFSLAPGLPSHLVLPEAIANSKGLISGLAHRLLVSFGLTAEESVRFQNEVLQLGRGYEFPRFLARPLAGKVPNAAPELLDDLQDYPDIGVYHFSCRLWFSASDRHILKEFGAWLRAQRRLLGFRKWGRVARKPLVLERDLVVFALSQAKGWSLAHICLQLDHMGLPSLAASDRTNLKGAVASIRLKVRRDIRKARGRVVPS